MPSDTSASPLTLSDFFAASEQRGNGWARLGVVARAWAAAAERGQSTDALVAEATGLLNDLAPLEEFWAYPGVRLMGVLRERLSDRDAAAFARLALEIRAALASGAYRHDAAAWDPGEEAEITAADFLPPALTSGEKHRSEEHTSELQSR